MVERENVQIIDDLRLITGFVIRVTGRVSLVEQELTIFPKHLCSPPVFGGVLYCYDMTVINDHIKRKSIYYQGKYRNY
jgi:hypothetical protein